MSGTLWATVSDMTTRLVWKTKDIRRTAASLLAFGLVGAVIALGLYGFLLSMMAIATEAMELVP